jgi:hypothetical protein
LKFCNLNFIVIHQKEFFLNLGKNSFRIKNFPINFPDKFQI